MSVMESAGLGGGGGSLARILAVTGKLDRQQEGVKAIPDLELLLGVVTLEERL